MPDEAAPAPRTTDRMLPGEEPKVRRMAMSRRLSLTTITMVETMLKAATANHQGKNSRTECVS